jgi:hypothetical protein
MLSKIHEFTYAFLVLMGEGDGSSSQELTNKAADKRAQICHMFTNALLFILLVSTDNAFR